MLASFNRMILASLAAIVALPLALNSPAVAQDTGITVRGLPEGTNMRLVSYGDLNLNLMAHRKILDSRINHAVREVCEFKPRDTDRGGYQKCADLAWAGAQPQMTRAYVQAARLAYGYRR
jgi:UrcA family protein